MPPWSQCTFPLFNNFESALTLDLFLLLLIKNIYERNPTYFARTKTTNCSLFSLDIFFIPTSIALNSLFVFCIRSDF